MIVSKGQTIKNKTNTIKILKTLWIITSEDSIKFLAIELNCPILFLILLTINYFNKKFINLNNKKNE